MININQNSTSRQTISVFFFNESVKEMKCRVICFKRIK
jgi:hypothetical protein